MNNNEQNNEKVNHILAEGEVTGHAHRVTVPVRNGKNSVKEFDGETTVSHEEHNKIDLPTNKWASDQVLQFDYLNQMETQVKD